MKNSGLDFKGKLKKMKRIHCEVYYSILAHDVFMDEYFLVNYYDKNWIWHWKQYRSQTFFSEKEALKAMKNNKVEWSVI